MLLKFQNALPLLAILACVACSKYDDSAINERVDALNARVEALEKWQATVNSQIQSLQTIVDALNQADRITDVEQLSDGSGYIVTFAKAGKMTILNGKDGSDGENGADGKDGTTPSISVKQDTDGRYYWTVNGDYLLDGSGNKISATASTVTPQIRINTDSNKFEYSTNNGVTWTEIGDAGNSSFGIFTKIEETEDNVVFYLADNSTISVPKKIALSIVLSSTSYGVTAGNPVIITYSLRGADDNTEVEAFASVSSYTIDNTINGTSGELLVFPPEPLVAGKIILIAFNDNESNVKVLTMEEGQLVVDESSISAPASGGEVSVKVSTNLSYTVRVDYSAMTWVSVVSTKALRTEDVLLSISENTSSESRTGTVDLIDDMGNILQTITIVQAGVGNVPSGGGSADLETVNEGTYSNTVSTYSTTAGWILTNGIPSDLSDHFPDVGVRPVLNIERGKTYGVLSSPILSGGCGTISIDYTRTKSKTGSKFSIDIKDKDGNVIKSVDHSDTTLAQWGRSQLTFDINVAGEFQIVVKGDTNKAKITGDNLAIISLSWTGYSE